MSGHRIKAVIPHAPHEAPQLTKDVGSLIDDLGTGIDDLRSVLDAASLGPRGSTLDVLVRGLAEDFAIAASREPCRQRRGDPSIAWRDMVNVLAEGPSSAGLPDWAPPAFRQVTAILAGDGFPCVFAQQANHLKSGWVCFVDSVATAPGRETVRQAILAYIDTLKRYPRGRATIMPLLVIVKPCYPMLSLKEYRDQAWGLFQYLHDNDPEPWQAEVPTDPDRGDWTLCFGGIQLFSNVSDPAHQIHRSRNLGDSLVFAMQPRTNFDLVGGNNPKGQQVRSEIRRRAERYEGRPVAPHLGFYGSPDNREWLQMATKDSEADHEFPAVCPFKFRSDKPPIQK